MPMLAWIMHHCRPTILPGADYVTLAHRTDLLLSIVETFLDVPLPAQA